MRYQLPCEACGKSTTIETSQAGQKIRCDCGADLEVPSLRGIRELEPAGESPPSRRSQSWSPGRGAAFAGGLVLLFLGVVLAGYAVYVRSQVDLSKPPLADIELVAEDTAALSMEQTLEMWQRVQEVGLGPYNTPMHVRMRQYHWYMGIVALVGMGMILVGVVSMGASMLSRGNQKRA